MYYRWTNSSSCRHQQFPVSSFISPCSPLSLTLHAIVCYYFLPFYLTVTLPPLSASALPPLSTSDFPPPCANRCHGGSVSQMVRWSVLRCYYFIRKRYVHTFVHTIEFLFAFRRHCELCKSESYGLQPRWLNGDNAAFSSFNSETFIYSFWNI